MALRHREVTAANDRTPDGLSGGSGLPALLARLIGREAAIVAGCDLLAKSRLVTLTGPGGIGKTQLALALGHEFAGRFSDGVAFVELATVLEPDLVLATVATTLGLRETGIEPVEQRLTTYFSERHILLILDNVRDVWQTGGLTIYGYPITEAFEEDGLTVQYFERARFEHHPTNAQPYDVLLGLLGYEALEARYGGNLPPGAV